MICCRSKMPLMRRASRDLARLQRRICHHAILRTGTMLLRNSLLVFIAVLAFAGIATDVQADQRVALVIGNSDYRNASRLPNPTNDAEAIGALFRKAGFDVVNLRRDLDVSEMRRAIGDFADAAPNADIPAVSYAAHQMTSTATNY